MFNKVKVLQAKEDGMGLVLIPVTNDKGVTTYKLYDIYIKHYNNDELAMDEAQYRLPISQKEFSEESAMSARVDVNGVLILDTADDGMKRYRKAKGLMDKDTEGDFIYNCNTESIVSDNPNIRWGRVKENDMTLNVYHSSYAKAKGQFAHNFYEILPSKMKQKHKLFKDDLVATPTRPILLSETPPVQNKTTGEMMPMYVNTHTMKYYNGLYGVLRDKNRRPGRYDILQDKTTIPSAQRMTLIANLESRVRFLKNTQSNKSMDAIERLDKAVKYFKEHGTVGAYYHCKLLDEIFETMLARNMARKKGINIGQYFEDKIKFLVAQESTCRRGMDFGDDR